VFAPTGLTGQYLDHAALEFTNSGNGKISGQPLVQLTFNDEGKALFSKITTEHKGEVLAIFLDGSAISTPVIQEAITDGKAVISVHLFPV
jgi:preprotein translocase subunit SecD